eukprot:CAMPEP_0178387390 /NCGR_PEP_ID=MMETSP0689_2-20121128/9050_1 /TAXON_ID=160604 /ORGANISM="Amphidinium massartii, Strain CS-259" /LENGTH=617 /DNA_ID=CAMNT_0020007755 /DNA_START=110 /DNA_END=1963 /DNA_ORIENTATION=+
MRSVLTGLVALCSFSQAYAFGSPWSWVTGGGSAPPVEKKHATDELTADTFDPFLESHPVTAVLFYAPWCFYSQQVMGPWDLAGQKLALHDPPVSVVKIDTSRYDSVGTKYGIAAFPTMKLFIDGSVFEYDQDGRTWQQIVKWVNRHLDRDHVLKSVEDADHFLHDNDLNVIGLFPDGYNSSIFAQSSRHFADVMFAEVRGTEIATKVAEHVARHAMLQCETVDVGAGPNNRNQVTLPRKDMRCGSEPRNPQRPEWTDTFAATVEGNQLVVTRTDSSDGWQQLLQLKCCDDEAKATKKVDNIPLPSIVMFMPHDERFARYTESMEEIHALDKFVTARRSPLIMHLTATTAEKLLGGGGPEKSLVLFLIASGKEEALEKGLLEAAAALRGRAIVCFTGSVTQIERRFMELAGADDASLPLVTLLEVQAGMGPRHNLHKYRLETAGLTSSKVVKFVDDYEAGKLKPWLRSEPEPTAEDQAEEAVGTLVGSTFVDVTQDKSKDVLVDFYAPWCGHCRKFEPQYKALAKRLQHVKSLRIMKIDATRNEFEGLMIEGFPTIALFPAGEKKGRIATYQGSRQPDDIIRWLHDHCTHKFSDKATGKAAEQPVERESGLLDESDDL